jgi:hypothetical protein
MTIKNKIGKYPKIKIFLVSTVLLYLILLIPLPDSTEIVEGKKSPFIWNQDKFWEKLEADFNAARNVNCDKVKQKIDSMFVESEKLLDDISISSLNPTDEKFRILENNIFNVATCIPTCSEYISKYINFYTEVRTIIKVNSRSWDMNSTEARNTVYRLLYGNRTAIEEVMLQLPKEQLTQLILGYDEPSSSPSAIVLGVTIHSGDILISRGGAPTSALIARGNDYPGNFSHVALIHIDEKTNLISVIESHIERGVTVSSLNEYLNDTKLRIMVLRLRSDLIENDLMIPHKAAAFALSEAKRKHIPYDFAMNYSDPDKLFCSEVASYAYMKFGIRLWSGLSTISSKGTRRWLSSFGVKNFETQEPSDLEYDPQVSVVAEWRDPETLYKDHLDNAVTDVMLEEADSGKQLSHDWYKLPLGRILKLYSTLLNYFGSEGPIPEGMKAEAALKNVEYSRKHDKIKERLVVLANEFKTQNGYRPPYWELVYLARQARDEI